MLWGKSHFKGKSVTKKIIKLFGDFKASESIIVCHNKLIVIIPVVTMIEKHCTVNVISSKSVFIKIKLKCPHNESMYSKRIL